MIRLPAPASDQEVLDLICRIHDAREQRARYTDVLDVMLGDHQAARAVVNRLAKSGHIRHLDNGVLLPVRAVEHHWQRYIPDRST